MFAPFLLFFVWFRITIKQFLQLKHKRAVTYGSFLYLRIRLISNLVDFIHHLHPIGEGKWECVLGKGF